MQCHVHLEYEDMGVWMLVCIKLEESRVCNKGVNVLSLDSCIVGLPLFWDLELGESLISGLIFFFF